MVEWITEKDPVSYETAENFMKERAAAIAAGEAEERIWLLEHPPLYTAGTSARTEDLVAPDRFPVHETGRGGQYTYHGPGQRVAYVMLDLKERGPDIRKFVCNLENWIIATLAHFGVKGERREGRVGIWVVRKGGTPHEREDKIAAIGIRLHKWVSFHGISINVNPDLEHFSGIIPCGIDEHGVTSLADLGHDISMEALDAALKKEFDKVFGAAAEETGEPSLATKGARQMQSSDLMVVYYVYDMKRAHAFYTEAVGLETKEASPYWTELACGEVTVALHILSEGDERGITRVPSLNLRVDELEPAIEKVLAAGGTLVNKREAEPHIPVRLAELKDTEGNLFEFRQEVDPS